MKKKHILYIGRHLEIADIVVRFINANKDWIGVGVIDDKEAFAIFPKKEFSIVLLGSGITMEEEDDLCSFFRNQNPKIIIIQHYGGGSGLLKSEILSAFQ
jgi:hypothetical protein